MRELNTPSYVEVMRAIQFFAHVIVNLDAGAEAFIEAQGPDILLTLNVATPPGLHFFFVNINGREESLWGEAIRVLRRNPETSQHLLLAAVELRQFSPAYFTTRLVSSDIRVSTAVHERLEQELIEVIHVLVIVGGWAQNRTSKGQEEKQFSVQSRPPSRNAIFCN
jgi:hypothetical protein